MEFWGVEVKAGEQLKVKPKFKCLIHISQATLGETKKGVEGGENIPLRVKIDDRNFVIGALSADARAQVMFDLVFEKEFELSHDWKNGSVHFMGYSTTELDSDDDDDDDDGNYTSSDNEDLNEEMHVGPLENGNAATADAATKKEDSADDYSDDSSEDSDESFDSEDGLSGEDAEEDNSSDEELPIPPKKSKKRPAESAAQPTPASIKKAKSPAPDKTVNKKVQNATPFLSKAAGKKPKQSPKSGAEFSGKSGNKFSDAKNSKNGKGKQRGGK